MKLPKRTSGIKVCFAIIIALSLTARASTIKNTNIELHDNSPEALIALGSFYKALDVIEKEKSYGDKYSDMVKKMRTSTSYDAKNQHPFSSLADKDLGGIFKKIQDSSVDMSKEDIVAMIKQVVDDGYNVFNNGVKEGKIKLAQE